MSEKSAFYQSLTAQALALCEGEPNRIAKLANLSALLNLALDDINWVGFYLREQDVLVLGPFQGKPACVRIPVGKGVCGTAVASGRVQRVANVHEFAGHIACDGASNSEIVLPLGEGEDIWAVLDIDSPRFDRFDDEDEAGLAQLVSAVLPLL
ncbi:Free methionine-(R)-sulfoxide reductase [Zobellella denitrificans]|uniref:Free methionine-(R)-sulfoxide reductase n=1 Tax=Zobellella denitrificans TaxID=347534 RepID=A0A231N2S6_9GAMM|nr:GAF domain-containing protein [Zobellella denitrificans]ATG73971.1 Free methionine-(R)-sulfoxide reductase [Zobellella denitrificans]OXS16216.1 Free methionine-(R)-sulfoxide reductase [Zobellella denitrificans]